MTDCFDADQSGATGFGPLTSRTHGAGAPAGTNSHLNMTPNSYEILSSSNVNHHRAVESKFTPTPPASILHCSEDEAEMEAVVVLDPSLAL